MNTLARCVDMVPFIIRNIAEAIDLPELAKPEEG
jgi:hypothetical protein